MHPHTCPWWVGYLLTCPLRRFAHHPVKLLKEHIRPGMTVLEPGPGMGFFTLDMARMVGDKGRVIVVDTQPDMLQALERRARKAKTFERIEARWATPESMGLSEFEGQVDFTLAFFVVHEMPSANDFFRQVAAASKPAAHVFLAEPVGHVGPERWQRELQAALEAGFQEISKPHVTHARAVLLEKK